MKNYLYHVGTELYSEIKSLKLVGGKILTERIKKLMTLGLHDDTITDYVNEVNGFTGEITAEHIDLLANHGFKVWDEDRYYVYKIDLTENSKVIKHISVTSTEEQSEYDKEHWDKTMDQHKDSDDKKYLKAKREYVEGRKRYLNNKGYYERMTLKEYLKSDIYERTSDMDYFVNKNLKCGNVEQYASCIPHLQITIKKPLQYYGYTVITKTHTISELDTLHIDRVTELHNNGFDKHYTPKEVLDNMCKPEYVTYGIFNRVGKMNGLIRLRIMLRSELEEKDIYRNNTDTKWICFISSLISEERGCGKELMRFVIELNKFVDSSIVLSARVKDLIPYYEQFGFASLPEREKSMIYKGES